jgi:hypothetical protein
MSASYILYLHHNSQCKVLKLADMPSCLGGGEKRTNAK